MNVEQANTLREAVHRAFKEVENNEPIPNWDDVNNHYGTWDQGTWGTVDPLVAARSWTPYTFTDDIEFLIAPEGDQIACGTTGCIAGHMAVIAGGRFMVSQSTVEEYLDHKAVNVVGVLMPEVRFPVSVMSAVSLYMDGFNGEFFCDEHQVHHGLFNASNTIDEVIHMADVILTSEGHDPTGLA